MSDKIATAIDPWAVQDAVNDQMKDGALFAWKFGWTFNVRPMNEWNVHYTSALRRASQRKDVKEHVEAILKDEKLLLDPDYIAQTRVYDMQAFALGCLVSWESVTARGGGTLKHSQGNACKLLEHFPGLYEDMRSFVSDPANFETAIPPSEEDQSGN